ncbi:MAG: hypothetical protein KKA84_03450 [Bacteroidetes bacterium]|nr:hypothetical protein [Bacteroidota bacterium]
MKRQKLYFLICLIYLLLVPVLINCSATDNNTIDPIKLTDSTTSCHSPDETKKVLLIGASYFFSLPQDLAGLAQSRNKDFFVDGIIIGGALLDYHANNLLTEERIRSEHWDHVILQGVCTNAAFPETSAQIFPPYVSHPLVPSIQSLMTIIEDNCDSTETIYQMPWAFEDGTIWLPGYNHSYFDMQQLIYDNVLAFANDLDFKVSPVGWAWNRVMSDRPGIKLFQSDFNHPSVKGAYLLACVVYVSIYGESVVGSSYLGTLSLEEATYLQEVASSTVLDNLPLWN